MKKVKISPKKILPTTKMSKMPKMSKTSNFTKYIMMILLIVILIFTGMYIFNINKAISHQEEKFIISEETANKKKYRIVMIYSKSCGYCEKFHPIFDSVAHRFSEAAEIEKHEAGTIGSKEFMSRVQGVPFMFVLKDGVVHDTKAGYMKDEQFHTWLKSAIV